MNKKGFTLVEILLAVMIVGLIGIALSAITTTAMRESGISRTRMILRSQLSRAITTLREDVQDATSINTAAHCTSNNCTLLSLAYDSSKKAGPDATGRTSVVYKLNTINAQDAPGGGTINNTIIRQVYGGPLAGEEKWLENVKVIAVGSAYYPSFEPVGGNGDSRIQAKLIVQTAGTPVVNEAVVVILTTKDGVTGYDTCLDMGTTNPCAL